MTAGQLPLVLGIIGDNKVLSSDHHETLKQSVKKILFDFKNEFPDTKIQLLTSLKKKSEQLAAEVGLENDVDVIVVTPFTPEQTETADSDIRSTENRSARILVKALENFCLPAPVADHGHSNIDQYSQAQTGAFIAKRCHILVALWDGKPSEITGSICQIVNFKLTGNMNWIPQAYQTVKNDLDLPNKGPVFNLILSNRHVTGDDIFELIKRYPFEESINKENSDNQATEKQFLKSLERLNEYNKDVVTFLSVDACNLEKQIYPLIPLNEISSLEDEQRNILEVYTASDQLAQIFQKRIKQTSKLLYFVSAFMPLVFMVYIKLWQQPPVIMFYVVLSFIVYLIYWYSRKKKYQIKYLDYRALAEGLRVQFFWRSIELTNPVRDLNKRPGGAVLPVTVSDCYLRKQNGVLDWIRDSIRIASLPIYGKTRQADKEHILNLVLKHWVNDQSNYYTRAAFRDEKKSKQFDRAILPLILIGGILSISLTGLFPVIANYPVTKNIMILCVGYLPAIGGLLKAYIFTMGYWEQSRQYERMANVFNQALNKINEVSDFDETISIIHELGKEALRENGDWVLLHRDRPIKVPGTGKSNLIEATMSFQKKENIIR